MNHFQALIDTSADRQQVGKTIHADCGYDSAANRQTLKANSSATGLRAMMIASATTKPTFMRNYKLSRIRARVEHVFGAWEKVIGKSIRCIDLVRATAQITLQAIVINQRRWMTLDARGASVA